VILFTGSIGKVFGIQRFNISIVMKDEEKQDMSSTEEKDERTNSDHAANKEREKAVSPPLEEIKETKEENGEMEDSIDRPVVFTPTRRIRISPLFN
jgi:hypothetical protein